MNINIRFKLTTSIFFAMLVLKPLLLWAADVKMQTGGGHDTLNQVRDLKKVPLSNQKEPPSWLEPDTKRPGADYKDFPADKPEVCQEACADDPDCKAFTYSRPDIIEGTRGRCYLKSAVPEPVGDDCCVSGVKPYKTEKPLTKEVTPGESAGGRGEGGMVLIKPPQIGMGSGKTVNPSGSLKEAKGSPEVKRNPEMSPAHTTRPSGVTPPVTPSESQRGQPVITRNKPVKPAKQSRPHKETAEDIIRSIDLGEENRRQKMAGIPPEVKGQKSTSPYSAILSAIENTEKSRTEKILSPEPAKVRYTLEGTAYSDMTYIIVPVYMYYLERYFGNAPNRTKEEIEFAKILDRYPSSHKKLKNALKKYKEMSLEMKKTRFDPDVVRLVSKGGKPLDITILKAKIGSQNPSLHVKVPLPPDTLVTKNTSDTIESVYRISISWNDNSDNEDGFIVYRAFKPHRSNLKSQVMVKKKDSFISKKSAMSLRNRMDKGSNTIDNIGEFKELVRLGPNKTEFIDDNLHSPVDQDDMYCYKVVAYVHPRISVKGVTGGVVKSKPSNISCSRYGRKYSINTNIADADKDGFPDKDDLCKYIPGIFPHGCPDDDNDGVPEGLLTGGDQCPNEPGYQKVSPDEPSYLLPPDGCPMKYTLYWMGMKVFNNSVDGSLKGKFFYNENNAVDKTKGEEPYLLFAFMNGSYQGIPNEGTNRWCCGDDIDVSAGKDFEPDSDVTGEENPALIDTIRKKGLKIFPVTPSEKSAVIDRKLGLALTVTLMEEDDKVLVSPKKNENLLSGVFGTAVSTAKGVSSCVTSGGLSCLQSIAGAVMGIIDNIFGFLKDDPPPVEVKDKDDFMGSAHWAIDRTKAAFKTYKTGTYPFFMDNVPERYWVGEPCDRQLGWWPCRSDGKFYQTMRVKLFFCLVRDGVPEKDIGRLCNPKNATNSGF